MKKTILFAAACVALVACNKNIDDPAQKSGESIHFEKGQKVTLSVGTDNQTRVSSTLNTTTGGVDFKWEAGDKIKVTVNTESAEFTLKSGAGSSSATFEGTMPADGSTFSVQYPVTDPDLTSQTYVANGLPKDKMKMVATECTLGTSFELKPQYAALRLNFYGTDETVSKIEVTVNDAANPSYTLSCGTGVTVGTTKADSTNFFIVVPAGSYKFSAEVYNNASTPASIDKFNAASQDFSAGRILNMPAKEITETGKRGTLNGHDYVIIKAKYDGTNDSYLKWATQNLAVTTSGQAKWKSTDYVIGDYFQWAAYDGYVSGTIPTNLVIYNSFNITSKTFSFKTGKNFNKSSSPYNVSSTSYSKYNSTDKKTTLENSDDVARIVFGSTWRMPSDNEFGVMYDATKWTWNGTDKGYYVTKKDEDLLDDKSNALLFFPATGYGTSNNTPTLYQLGTNGFYWSSTPTSDDPVRSKNLGISSTEVKPGTSSSSRANGFPVRPVSD